MLSSHAPVRPAPDCSESRQKALHSVTWIFYGITTLIYIGRVYTRARLVKDFWWDDVSMGIAWAVLGFESILVTLSTRAGLGTHMACLSEAESINAIKWQIIAEGPGVLGPPFGRAAVSILIARVLKPPKLGIILLWFINLVFSASFSIVAAVLSFTRCSPTAAEWNSAIPHTCNDEKYLIDIAIIGGAFFAVTDFILALYPVSIIWSLQLHLKKKLGACLLMSLGIFAGIIGSIRNTLFRTETKIDYTWSTAELVIFVLIEANLIIICGSTPTLGPLVRWLKGGKSKRGDRPGGSSLRAMRNSNNPWLQRGFSRHPSRRPMLQEDSIFQLEQAEDGGFAGGAGRATTAARTEFVNYTARETVAD